MRLRLSVAYDGRPYSGWARQPGRPTVQGELELALQRALRLPDPPRTTCAGRTDAGVHARGQVCHVDLPGDLLAGSAEATGLGGLRARLASALPVAVRVPLIEIAPPGFDARFSALWRRYVYRVCDDPAGLDPLRRHEVLIHHGALDVAAMTRAASGLLGEHDFAAFCRPREGASTVRRLEVLDWQRETAATLAAEVRADGFCHAMVRSLVGALLAVGTGRRTAQWPASVLAAGVRDPSVVVVPAHGLTLEEVGYPGNAQLAARAAVTRARRGSP